MRALSLAGALILAFSCLAAEAIRKPSPFPEKDREREATEARAARHAEWRSRRPAIRKGQSGEAPAPDTGKACFFSPRRSRDADAAATETRAAEDRELTASHSAYTLGERVSVTNLANGRSVEVTITGRFFDPERIISVSEAAAERLGFRQAGTADVKLAPVRASQPERER